MNDSNIGNSQSFALAKASTRTEEKDNYKLFGSPIRLKTQPIEEKPVNSPGSQSVQSDLSCGSIPLNLMNEPQFEMSSITSRKSISTTDISVFVVEGLEKLDDVHTKNSRGFKKEPEQIIHYLKNYFGVQDTTLLEHIIWGIVYYRRYNTEKAWERLEQAEKIIKVYRKQDVPVDLMWFKLLRMVYNAKAHLLVPSKNRKKLNKAKEYLDKEKLILFKLFPDDVEKKIINTEVESKLHLHRKKFNKAVKCLEKVLNYKEQFGSKNSQAIIYLHFSHIYLAQGNKQKDMSKALKDFCFGFKLIEQEDSKNYIMGRFLCRMGQLYLKLSKNNEKEAKNCYVRGLDILKVSLQEENVITKELLSEFNEKFNCEHVTKEKSDLPTADELIILREEFENKVVVPCCYNLNKSSFTNEYSTLC